MFSTFLSGPVAMMATLAALRDGILHATSSWASPTARSRAAARSKPLIRSINQMNVTSQLEPGLTTDVVKAVDAVHGRHDPDRDAPAGISASSTT